MLQRTTYLFTCINTLRSHYPKKMIKKSPRKRSPTQSAVRTTTGDANMILLDKASHARGKQDESKSLRSIAHELSGNPMIDALCEGIRLGITAPNVMSATTPDMIGANALLTQQKNAAYLLYE